MKLGAFLKRYREARNISGRQLSEQIGVSKFRLQKWEDAGVFPKWEDAEKISAFFGVRELNEIPEEVLNSCIEKVPMSSGLLVESLLKQKDELLAEKDKRIHELNRTISILEETLAVYKTGKKGGK